MKNERYLAHFCCDDHPKEGDKRTRSSYQCKKQKNKKKVSTDEYLAHQQLRHVRAQMLTERPPFISIRQKEVDDCIDQPTCNTYWEQCMTSGKLLDANQHRGPFAGLEYAGAEQISQYVPVGKWISYLNSFIGLSRDDRNWALPDCSSCLKVGVVQDCSIPIHIESES